MDTVRKRFVPQPYSVDGNVWTVKHCKRPDEEFAVFHKGMLVEPRKVEIVDDSTVRIHMEPTASHDEYALLVK